MIQIVLSLPWQILPAAGTGDIRFPPGQCLIHRRSFVNSRLMGRHLMESFPTDTVFHADLYLIHFVQHVQIGDNQSCHTVDSDGIAQSDQIQPATPALPPGCSSIFIASVTFVSYTHLTLPTILRV